MKGQKINAKWMREHFAYDVRGALKEVQCPTLVITGSKDLQVVPAQAESIANTIKGPAEYHIIADMNHILRKDFGKPSMLNLIKNYKKLLKEPIDPELIQVLSRWLTEWKTNFKT